MDQRRISNRYRNLAFATLCALGGTVGVSGANAADPLTAASIQSQYEHDVQRCNSGQTNQSKAVCLQEAGAARQEAERRRLDDGQSANYKNNAVDRCAKLPQTQREDCLLQMQAPSRVQGSVESGGVLRQTEIQVPAPQPGTAPSSTVPGTPMSNTMPGAPSGTPMPSTTPGTPQGTPMPTTTPSAPSGTPMPSTTPSAPSGTPMPSTMPGTSQGTPMPSTAPGTTAPGGSTVPGTTEGGAIPATPLPAAQ